MFKPILFLRKLRQRKQLRRACQPLIDDRFAVHYFEGHFMDSERVAKLKSKNIELDFFFSKLTIVREHLATKIWRYKETQLVYEICDAFTDVKLGDGIGMKEAQCTDDWIKFDDPLYQQARADDERENWLAIALSWWFGNPNDYCGDVLSFIDAKGLYFHLPVFLVMGYSDHVEYGYLKSLQEAMEGTTPAPYRESNRIKYTQYFAMLTKKQKKVMLKILEHEVDYKDAINSKRQKRTGSYFCVACQRDHFNYGPMTKEEVIEEVENSNIYKLWKFFEKVSLTP